MTVVDHRKYRLELVRWVASLGAPAFHATAMLPPGSGQAILEDRLRAWDARVNRYYLGRNWSRESYRPYRMAGIVFFETSPHVHAHCLVRPPHPASPSDFLLRAAMWFTQQIANEPDRLQKAVTRRGRMRIDAITPTAEDLQRVAAYDTKEMEWSRDLDRWKFIDQLAPLTREA